MAAAGKTPEERPDRGRVLQAPAGEGPENRAVAEQPVSALNRHVHLHVRGLKRARGSRAAATEAPSPTRGLPTDWAELVQAHDDRDVFQASSDELPAIDIHSLWAVLDAWHQSPGPKSGLGDDLRRPHEIAATVG